MPWCSGIKFLLTCGKFGKFSEPIDTFCAFFSKPNLIWMSDEHKTWTNMSPSITEWMKRNTLLGEIASWQSTTDLTLLTFHWHYTVIPVNKLKTWLILNQIKPNLADWSIHSFIHSFSKQQTREKNWDVVCYRRRIFYKFKWDILKWCSESNKNTWENFYHQ